MVWEMVFVLLEIARKGKPRRSVIETYVPGSINSHYFHIIGDKLINPIVGVYIPIIRIPIKGGMTIPRKTRLLTMAHISYVSGNRFVTTSSRRFPHCGECGESKGKPFKSLIWLDELLQWSLNGTNFGGIKQAANFCGNFLRDFPKITNALFGLVV